MSFILQLNYRFWFCVLLGMSALGLTACTEPVIVPLTLTPTPGATPTLPASPTPTSTATPTATVESIKLPTPLPTNTMEPSTTPETAWLPGEIRIHPGPLHYDGDIVSIEVQIENISRLPSDNRASLSIDQGDALDAEPVILRSTQAHDVLLFRWVWDTTGRAGVHQLNVFVPVDNSGNVQELIAFVEVLPADARPDAGEWQQLEEFCCLLYYVDNTAAARDIQQIQTQVRNSVSAVEETVGFALDEKPFDLAVIGTVLPTDVWRGHPPLISYVDRDYMNQDLDVAVRRWAAYHALRSISTDAPTILREGAIDYIAGGHYYREDFAGRAAALIDLDVYIPLADLANNFHRYSPDVAYLESAAFVEYLAETYTWPQFLVIYAVQFPETGAQWLDKTLQLIVFKDLDLVESEFLEWLARHDSEAAVENVGYTLRLYDTIRRYHAAYAPVQVALPDLGQALEAGITADFVRRATDPENVAIETLLIEAHLALAEGRTVTVESWLDAIDAALLDGDFTREPIGDYVAIVDVLRSEGYDLDRIVIAGQTATVEGRDVSGARQTWVLNDVAGIWTLSE